MDLTTIIPIVVVVLLIAFIMSKKKSGKSSKGYKLGDRLRGSIWFHAGNIGGQANDNNGRPVSDELVRHWLDETKAAGLNSITLRVDGWIVRDNGSIDGGWANRITWFLNEAAARNLVVILGVGSAWGRKRGSTSYAELKEQVLNWWDNKGPITPYLKYVASNWGSRPNVILCFNEMGRKGHAKQWKNHANHYYNVLKQNGARYIATSENDAWVGSEDIRLMHNQRLFNAQPVPWGCDEPAGGDDLYKDSAIRNPGRFPEYRSYFNRAKNNNASIIYACSWINRHKPADAAVRRVFKELANT